MAEQVKKSAEEWKARFETVGHAQARYLYILLIAGTFYWALHVQVRSAGTVSEGQELPLVGVSVDPDVIWATGPLVLGFLLLAALGTFDALSQAADGLRGACDSDEEFERLDLNPTAIDFIVYSKSSLLRRLGLLSYPAFLSLVFLEASWILGEIGYRGRRFPGQYLLLASGAGVLIWTVPRLAGLWSSKVKKAIMSGGHA